MSRRSPAPRVNASSSLLAMADHAAPAQAALEEVLNDPYNRVRLNAVRALQQMGVPNAGLMPALDGVVSGSSLCDAVEAADLLLSMGRAPKSLVPVLMQGMADPELSEVVIADLGELREDPAYLPVLLMGLKSDNPKVTAGSVSLLAGASYASPEVTAAIRAATSDSAPDVRANAAAALVAGGAADDKPGMVEGPGSGSGNESIAKLLKLVSDRDATVRSAAVESLGRLKDASPEVIAALRARLGDPNQNVQEAAADARLSLTETGGPPTVLGIDHLDCSCASGRAR